MPQMHSAKIFSPTSLAIIITYIKSNILSQQGLSDHKEARRFASNMLKNGYIQNTVNKSEKFSDQCYYICGDGSKMKTASADRLQTDMQGMLCAVRHASRARGIKQLCFDCVVVWIITVLCQVFEICTLQ